MSNPLDRLRNIKSEADENNDARRSFKRFIDFAREALKWSDDDVAEYTGLIKILMGKDDEAALNLFPENAFATADDARKAAVMYWNNSK